MLRLSSCWTAMMSESTEKLSEQEQELRRRNINVGSGEFDKNSDVKETTSENEEGNDNDLMDSDHVSNCVLLISRAMTTDSLNIHTTKSINSDFSKLDYFHL